MQLYCRQLHLYEHNHLEKKEILLQYFTRINDHFYYQTGSNSIKITDGNYNGPLRIEV